MASLGRYGEEQAAGHLRSLGFSILDRNWRCERGEIDMVALDGKVMVFVEVKTRSSKRMGMPEEAVDIRKQEQLRLLARYYINRTGQTARAYRFDVVAVDISSNDIRVIKNAF
jgi:putative endonuclease